MLKNARTRAHITHARARTHGRMRTHGRIHASTDARMHGRFDARKHGRTRARARKRAQTRKHTDDRMFLKRTATTMVRMNDDDDGDRDYGSRVWLAPCLAWRGAGERGDSDGRWMGGWLDR